MTDALSCEGIRTPVFVYDECCLARTIESVAEVVEHSGSRLLYSAKSFAFGPVVGFLAPWVDGFSTSSLFEARLIRDSIDAEVSVHITAPGFPEDDISEICEICDYVSFNSLGQWERFRSAAEGRTACGLRLNPQCSFLNDARYDPCKKHSKLGVPLDDLVARISQSPEIFDGISGIHFHNNADSSDFGELLTTVRHLDANIGPLLSRLQWINIGGGYLFDDPSTFGQLFEAAQLLQRRHRLEIFLEPGAAIVREAGYLIASVLDLLDSDGKTVAVLDTTVNHLPEFFEYGYCPDVIGDRDEGPHEYILAGCSCLAGDLFGEYAFDEALEVGSRVVFANVGAYSLVKANRFNGINLPSIYALTAAGELVLIKRFTYGDFASHNGVDTGVVA